MCHCALVFCSFVFVSFASCTIRNISLYDSPEDNPNSCIVKIIQQLQDFMSIRDVTLMNPDDSLEYAIKDLKGLRFVTRNYYWVNASLYNHVYVFSTKTYEELYNGISDAKKDVFWNPKAAFIIAIEDLFVDNIKKRVSELLLSYNIYNVSVIGKSESNGYLIYAFPSQFNSCHKPEVDVVQFMQRCSKFKSQESVYPIIDIKSFKGCHFKLITHSYWPFVSLNGSDLGVEQYIIKLIQEAEDVYIELVDYGETEKFGRVLDNFTLTNMLHRLETNEVEGALGGYTLSVNRFKALSFVYPYMTDYYRVIVARADYLDKWSAVLVKFKFVTIFLLFLVFCVVCFAVTKLSVFSYKQKDYVKDIFIVYGYFLSNISNKGMKSDTPRRLIIICLLIFVMVFTDVLDASLLSATTRPIRGHQVETLEEVFATHHLILSAWSWDFIHRQAVINMDNAENCSTTLECMMRIKKYKNNKLYTIASNIYHEHIIWKLADSEGNLEIYKLKDQFCLVLQTILFRRGSSVLECFHKYIDRMVSGGLLGRHFSHLQFQERIKYHFHNHEYELPFMEMKFVLIIISLCYVISITVFILEIKSKRNVSVITI